MSAGQDIPTTNLASNRQLWRLNELGLLPTFWGLPPERISRERAFEMLKEAAAQGRLGSPPATPDAQHAE